MNELLMAIVQTLLTLRDSARKCPNEGFEEAFLGVFAVVSSALEEVQDPNSSPLLAIRDEFVADAALFAHELETAGRFAGCTDPREMSGAAVPVR